MNMLLTQANGCHLTHLIIKDTQHDLNDQKMLTESENKFSNNSWTDNIITAKGTTFPDTKLHAGCCVRQKPNQIVSIKVGIIPICWLGATNGWHLSQIIVDITKCKRETLDSEEKSHQARETCKEIFRVKCLVRFCSLRYLYGIQRVFHSRPLLYLMVHNFQPILEITK